jgi:hypothetical protein
MLFRSFATAEKSAIPFHGNGLSWYQPAVAAASRRRHVQQTSSGAPVRLGLIYLEYHGIRLIRSADKPMNSGMGMALAKLLRVRSGAGRPTPWVARQRKYL